MQNGGSGRRNGETRLEGGRGREKITPRMAGPEAQVPPPPPPGPLPSNEALPCDKGRAHKYLKQGKWGGEGEGAPRPEHALPYHWMFGSASMCLQRHARPVSFLSVVSRCLPGDRWTGQRSRVVVLGASPLTLVDAATPPEALSTVALLASLSQWEWPSPNWLDAILSTP
eukprot:358593-Chlamydomonas_euryale.AAC.4